MNYLCSLMLPGREPVKLETKLAPIFLRFAFLPIMGEDTTWRALDQLTIAIHPGEEVLVAARVALDDPLRLLTLPTDGTTRIEGGVVYATYQPVDPQPDRAAVRDASKWLAWQLQRLAEANFPPRKGMRDQ